MKRYVMSAVRGIIITSRATGISLKFLKGRLSGIAGVSQGKLHAIVSAAMLTYFFYGRRYATNERGARHCQSAEQATCQRSLCNV